MDTQEVISQLQQFRQELYLLLPLRRDALLDLLDALSSSPNARSPVELSLSPLFRREYGSVRDATTHFFQASSPESSSAERRAWEKELAQLIGRYLPTPQHRPFWLLGTDVVPIPRPFAQTLEDRSFVYQPNLVRGNKPVTIGHAYSVTAFLPEPGQPDDPPWAVPLIVRRVHSDEKATVVGAEQVITLLQDDHLPFHRQLCVHVADSVYSAVEHLGRVGHLPNLVSVTRAAENRVFYRQSPPPEGGRSQGHPTWYGAPFNLKDPRTWGTPDVTAETTFTTKQGRAYRVQLQGWHNLLMRGRRGLPMQRYPFTLVRGVVLPVLARGRTGRGGVQARPVVDRAGSAAWRTLPGRSLGSLRPALRPGTLLPLRQAAAADGGLSNPRGGARGELVADRATGERAAVVGA